MTLQVVYLAVGTLGIGSYVYDELLMRRLLPTGGYTVSSVTRPTDNVVEMQLTPRGAALTPRAGQFVFLRIGGDDRWHEQPFSVAALDSGGRLRVSVRGLGPSTGPTVVRRSRAGKAVRVAFLDEADEAVPASHVVFVKTAAYPK